MSTKKLFIVDGHAICYRAYFAFAQNPLMNSKGQNVSAIYGFFRMMLKLIEEQKPDYFIVAFDPTKKSFRFDMYPEYKANRQKMPDDLRSQIEEIKEALPKFDIPVVVKEGFEADDLLGSFAKKFASNDCHVMIVTGDKDAYQLVNENVSIYANKKGISEFDLYGPAEVEAKLGVTPAQIIDYMALTGDSSDNVPGVHGVGEKTAQKLIAEYGSIEKIYESIDRIKGKIGEKIASSKEMAFLSKKLVTIKTDIELDYSLEKIIYTDINRAYASEFFLSHEMKSLANEFSSLESKNNSMISNKVHSIETSPHQYKIITAEEDLAHVIERIKKIGRVSVDTETTSVKPVDAEILGISLSVAEGEGWYVPLAPPQTLFGNSDGTLTKSEALLLLKPVLEDGSIKKCGQNIKYDIIVLGMEGIRVEGVVSDSMVASYLLDPTEHRHNLDDMALEYLSYKTITYEELTGKGKNSIPLSEVPTEKVSDYSCEDADIALRLCNYLEERIVKNSLQKLYNDIEIPLVSILAEIESTGVHIDSAYFLQLAKETDAKIYDLVEKIYSDAGETFNINSTKELSNILFEKLALKKVKKTKTGFSTDISVLEELDGSHPIVSKLIEYRTLAKLKGTYIDTLPTLISKKTGRIHTSFNQAIVATGRLSSSDPNLQNIPARDEFGSRIRKGFVASDGWKIISADYSQIELRIAAHMSADENMMRAFRDGVDIHSLTASNVFDTPIDSLEPWMRRQAKIINFATIYGVSPYGLSKQADISIHDAAIFIDKYFATYPLFRTYIDKTVHFARENGYVETLFGRRRYIPEINSSAVFRREGAERIAINTPIQGSSADIIKKSMIDIFKILKDKKLKSRMILQVHDELVFESPDDEVESLSLFVKQCMENTVSLRIPLIVDINSGKSWGDAH